MTLTLPESTEVLDLVELLIGEKPVFRPGDGWDLSQPNPGAYITFLQAKNNNVEGAIITDLAATLYIGGKLILLPEATLKEQFDACEADEPVIDALTEVINNLRTLYNNIELNPHVAPTQTFPYQVPDAGDFVGWILDPKRRIDLVGQTCFGQATLTLIAP